LAEGGDFLSYLSKYKKITVERDSEAFKPARNIRQSFFCGNGLNWPSTDRSTASAIFLYSLKHILDEMMTGFIKELQRISLEAVVIVAPQENTQSS